jgi:hypothetical protein
MDREPRRVAPGGAEVAPHEPSDPANTILRRGSMARKFARILLATLVGVALGGFIACGDTGPAEQAEQVVEEVGDVAAEAAEAAKEVVEKDEEETQ